MDSIHRRAVDSLLAVFESLCEGAITVDRHARITWISDKYRRLLGLDPDAALVGLPIEQVIPNSLMRQVVESGRPILLDLMQFENRNLVVTRIPVFDEDGVIAGAAGLVLYDRVDYLKPLMSKFNELRSDLEQARRALAVQRQSRYSFSHCIGNSPAMLATKRRARRAAQSDSTVLLLGETGTGKELFAQAIHHASPRAKAPFVGVNVAAVPESLLEAEYFGVASGAFTGAGRQARKGKFEIADGGTLFLDEVGDMPMPLQTKLLRVLQEQEIEPLGSNRVLSVNVRVIAATSIDLGLAVDQGRFRADLYYRLNVLPIHLPPLRERMEDLPLLVESLLDEITARNAMAPRELTPRALAILMRHGWPGNIRELRNVLESCCAICDRNVIDRDDLSAVLPRPLASSVTKGQARLPKTLEEAVAEAEERSIREALEASGGRRSQAARILGISRAKFYQRLERYGIRSDSPDPSG